MKRYKLLKDLPFVKAGVFFREINDNGTAVLAPEDCDPHRHMFPANEIQNFDEGFEEIKEPEVYYYLSEAGAIIESEWSSGTHYAHVLTGEEFIQNLKSIGNYSKTREEAEKHLKWLKARATLLEDTKGFKPDWGNFDQFKTFVCYDDFWSRLCSTTHTQQIHGDICFKTSQDAESSIQNHEKEWKIYLGVE